jgi:hypothetical protein
MRCSLKDAKDAVEALSEKHGVASGRAGCMMVLSLWLAIAQSLYWFAAL